MVCMFCVANINLKDVANGAMDIVNGLVRDLVALFSAEWATIAPSVTVNIDGAETPLDPLNLGTVAEASGGACPWACGHVGISAVRGLATMTVDADAAQLQMRRCAPLALTLTAPLTFGALEVDATVKSTLLGMPVGASPLLQLKNVSGSAVISLPLALSADGSTLTVNATQLAAAIYIDVHALSGVSAAWPVVEPMLNAALQSGLAPLFERLASREVSTALTNFLQDKASSWQPLSLPAALFPGVTDAPPQPQSCHAPTQTWQTPCDPCDVCCNCATQGRCGDATCAAQCGACMPAVCKPPLPPLTIWVLVLVALLLLAIVVGVGVGVWKLATRRSTKARSTARARN